jgi:hypothetical protein
VVLENLRYLLSQYLNNFLKIRTYVIFYYVLQPRNLAKLNTRGYFTALRFATLTDLQMKNEKGM